MDILIADSNITCALELDKKLSGWGHHVTLVYSAAQALDAVRQHVYELAILELLLNDAMGYEIIPDLKLFNPGVRIIMMTEKDSPDLERKSRASGIIFFMEKPVAFDHLKQIIDRMEPPHV